MVLEGTVEGNHYKGRLCCNSTADHVWFNCRIYIDIKRRAENRAYCWIAANQSTDWLLEDGGMVIIKLILPNFFTKNLLGKI